MQIPPAAATTSRNKISLLVYISKYDLHCTNRQKRIAWRISPTFQGDDNSFRLIPLHRRRNLLNLRWPTRVLIIVTLHNSRYQRKEKKKKGERGLPRNLLIEKFYNLVHITEVYFYTAWRYTNFFKLFKLFSFFLEK